ncbi:hypothetical protein [Nocardia sp. NPDC005978]|uniref:hypothetical protein n=1 Tax=unclassified Nocardia TaxID=2637762 RepID=UPI0033A7680F
MAKRLLGGLALGALTALSVPGLIAGSASAKVAGITASAGDFDCTVESGCGVNAVLTGPDRFDPVTVTIDGVVVADAVVPDTRQPGEYVYVSLLWRPANNGKHTITVTQGASTMTAAWQVPGRLHYPQPATGSSVLDALGGSGSGSKR